MVQLLDLMGFVPSTSRTTVPSLGTELIDTLVEFLNTIIIPGRIPEAVRPAFYGAKLMALSKPCGGIRPIAIGGTPRRLAGKIVMSKLQDSIRSTFQPHQLGVGTRKGSEIAVHVLRKYLQCESGDKVVLKIDYRNAFNCIRRDKFLTKVRELFPDVYPMVWQAYSSESNLYFNGHTLLSTNGVHQGDPIGPFLFSLGILDIMKECQSEVSLWYLDGTLAGDPETVLNDFQRLIESSKSIGLEVNLGKCELFFTKSGGNEAAAMSSN